MAPHALQHLEAKIISQAIAKLYTMSQRGKLGQSLTTLGLDTLSSEPLESEPLESLEQRLCRKSLIKISKDQVLQAYIEWLGKRLQAVDMSSTSGFSAEISSWCHSLYTHGFDKDSVLSRFLQWMLDQLTLEPGSARMLGLTELEIREVFPSPGTPGHAVAGGPMPSSHEGPPALVAPEPHYSLGQMHPDRVSILDLEPHSPSKVQSGHTPVIDLATWERPVVVISSDSSDEDHLTLPPKTKQNPSFLTGPNGTSLSNSPKDNAGKGRKKTKKARKRPTMSERNRASARGQPLPQRNRSQEPGASLQGQLRVRQQHQEDRVAAAPARMMSKLADLDPAESVATGLVRLDYRCFRCNEKGTCLLLPFDVRAC